jgi:flavin-dependent dehydrogenase
VHENATAVTPIRRRYDVVVVGGRCAGAGTALQLARAGLDVLVIDRAPSPGDTLSTHALLRAGVLQLHRWGVLDDVVAAGTPPVRRTTFHLADGDVLITIKPLGGIDAFYAPRRSVLDAILVDAAAAAGADVRFGTRAVDLLREGDRVTGVLVLDDSGRAVPVRARLVVGADGRDSAVAAWVGAATDRVATASSSVVYGYIDAAASDQYRWWFRRGGSAGLIPTNDGQACIFAGGGTGPGSPLAGSGRPADVLRRAIAATAPELVEDLAAAPITGVRRFAGRPGHLRRPWGPGWVLVGDAGYLKDPITAHGMSDALRDAELAARAVLHVIGGEAEAEAMGGFQELRDRLSIPLFDVAEQLASHTWSDEEVRDTLLRLSSAMSDEVELLLDLVPIGAPVGAAS